MIDPTLPRYRTDLIATECVVAWDFSEFSFRLEGFHATLLVHSFTVTTGTSLKITILVLQ
jgi:hypothetical protein